MPNTVLAEQGTVLAGNLADDSVVLVSLDPIAGGGGRTKLSFQVKVNQNVETRQLIHQAKINRNQDEVGGAFTILSDDPDTEAIADSTITLLMSAKNTNVVSRYYVPLIENQ